jgi:hypothetical protein
VDDSDEAWYEALRAGATEDVEADDTTTPESEAGYSSSSGDTEDRWFEDIRSEGSGDDTGSQPPPISISDSAAATQTSNVAGTVPLVSRIAIYLALVVAALTIATMAL